MLELGFSRVRVGLELGLGLGPPWVTVDWLLRVMVKDMVRVRVRTPPLPWVTVVWLRVRVRVRVRPPPWTWVTVDWLLRACCPLTAALGPGEELYDRWQLSQCCWGEKQREECLCLRVCACLCVWVFFCVWM